MIGPLILQLQHGSAGPLTFYSSVHLCSCWLQALNFWKWLQLIQPRLPSLLPYLTLLELHGSSRPCYRGGGTWVQIVCLRWTTSFEWTDGKLLIFRFLSDPERIFTSEFKQTLLLSYLLIQKLLSVIFFRPGFKGIVSEHAWFFRRFPPGLRSIETKCYVCVFCWRWCFCVNDNHCCSLLSSFISLSLYACLMLS